jgi:hypothetical protein
MTIGTGACSSSIWVEDPGSLPWASSKPCTRSGHEISKRRSGKRTPFQDDSGNTPASIPARSNTPWL